MLEVPFLGELLRGTPGFQIQLAGHRKQRIPQRLGIQSLHIRTPQQPVFGVDEEVPSTDAELRAYTAESIISRCKAFSDQPPFSQPAAIEQCRVTGAISNAAEIARSAHDAGAEMMLPDAIGHDARGEGIGGADDSLRQVQSATACSERLRLTRAEDGEKMARNFFAQVVLVTGDADTLIMRFGGVPDDMSERIGRRLRTLQLGQLGAHFLQAIRLFQ